MMEKNYKFDQEKKNILYIFEIYHRVYKYLRNDLSG